MQLGHVVERQVPVRDHSYYSKGSQALGITIVIIMFTEHLLRVKLYIDLSVFNLHSKSTAWALSLLSPF